MRPKAKRPDTEAAAARGRSLQIYNTGPPRTGLAFRTRPTAPTQACTQTGAATTSQTDPIRAERLRGRAWGGATSCTASHTNYERAPGFPGRGGISADPCTPRMFGPRALFDRGTIGSKKGVLPVPGPPTGFYFRFPTRKNDGPSRTCHGTRPQDGRRYAVPPSPTGQASRSPAFQA